MDLTKVCNKPRRSNRAEPKPVSHWSVRVARNAARNQFRAINSTTRQMISSAVVDGYRVPFTAGLTHRPATVCLS